MKHNYVTVTPKGPRIAIISAERKELSAYENTERSLELRDILLTLGIKFKSAEGYYEGTQETSFVCIVPKDTELACIRRLCCELDQECILIANEYRDAYLDFVEEDRIVPVGKLLEVTERPHTDNYTEMDGRFFLTVDNFGR